VFFYGKGETILGTARPAAPTYDRRSPLSILYTLLRGGLEHGREWGAASGLRAGRQGRLVVLSQPAGICHLPGIVV